ncbi:alcohol dehydrogenase catalytic domain-containing protein [Microbispora rosea]
MTNGVPPPRPSARPLIGVYASSRPHARLGCEGTGIVDALGEGVEGYDVGDAVVLTAVPDMTANGTYAEHTVLPATRIIKRPEGLSPVSAAALWVAYSTAYGALVEKAGMKPGDQVLITAASGTVGLAAIQIANHIGATPIAVTRHAAKRDDLLAAGAAAVVATDTEDIVQATHLHRATAVPVPTAGVRPRPILPPGPRRSVHCAVPDRAGP